MATPAPKQNMMFVRLRPYNVRLRNVLRTYTIHGVQFREDRGWYEVPDTLAELLRNVRQQESDPTSPNAFDVCTYDEANRMDEQEEKARRAAFERAQARDARPVGRRDVLTASEAAAGVDRRHTVTTADLPSSAAARRETDALAREDAQRGRPREAELHRPDDAWTNAGNAAAAEKEFEAIEKQSARTAPSGKGAPPPPTVPKGARLDPSRNRASAPAQPQATNAQARAALGKGAPTEPARPKVTQRGPRKRGRQLPLPNTGLNE